MLPPSITPYTDDEISAITHYVEVGGGLFVIEFAYK